MLILLMHPNEHVLALVAGYGQSDRLEGRSQGGYNRFLRFVPGEGIAGRVAQTLEPYLCRDVTSDPCFARLDNRVRVKSLFALPLVHENRLLGVLNVSDGDVDSFTEHRRRGLILLSAVISQLLVFCQQRRMLTESEAFHKDLVENAADVMMATDMGLCLTSLNRAGRDMLGLEPAEVDKLHLLSCVVEDDVETLRGCVHKLIYGHDVPAERIRFACPGGETHELRCSFRLIVDDGWPLGIEIIGRYEARPTRVNGTISVIGN